MPVGYATRAYDAPIPIPHHQVTTQPSLSAAIIAALGLTGTEEVFEVGTGYGYQTALLARLAARVISIGIWPDLAGQARRNLAAHGIGNVVVLADDGTGGAPEFAPPGAIVVCGLRRLPSRAIAAGRPAQGEARLVQPVGPGGAERVVLYQMEPNGLRRVQIVTAASFARLHDSGVVSPAGAVTAGPCLVPQHWPQGQPAWHQ